MLEDQTHEIAGQTITANARTVTPCGPYRNAELKSNLLPRAPHQPSSIEVHSASSTPASEEVPPIA